MFDALFNEGTFRFPSHEVSRFSLARVINMDVNIESARNDEFGYKLPFEKVISESAGYDFVQVMFDWAVKAQLKIDESFFCIGDNGLFRMINLEKHTRLLQVL